MLIASVYKIGGVHFRLLGTNGFHVKAKKERFTAASSRCRWKFHFVVWQTTSKHCTKKLAARAARLFFFIQPIRLLICGVASLQVLSDPTYVVEIIKRRTAVVTDMAYHVEIRVKPWSHVFHFCWSTYSKQTFPSSAHFCNIKEKLKN